MLIFFSWFKHKEYEKIFFETNNENNILFLKAILRYLIETNLITNNCKNNHFLCLKSSFEITDRGKKFIKHILENNIKKDFVGAFHLVFNQKPKLSLDIKEFEKKLIFIGISYNSELKERIKAIKEGIEKNGYKNFLVLNQHSASNTLIDSIIIESIKESTFGIFDISYVHDKKCNSYHPNIGAIFEAGFMMGSNKDILLICSEEDQERVHFNLRNRPILFFNSDDDLKEKLNEKLNEKIKKLWIGILNYTYKNKNCS